MGHGLTLGAQHHAQMTCCPWGFLIAEIEIPGYGTPPTSTDHLTPTTAGSISDDLTHKMQVRYRFGMAAQQTLTASWRGRLFDEIKK